MPHKKLNVIFLASWYPSQHKPHLGIFIKRHAIALSKTHNVVVINLKGVKAYQQEASGIELVREESLKTITATFVNDDGVTNRLLKPLRALTALKTAFKYYNDNFERPDLIHINVIQPIGGLFHLCGYYKNIPLFITEHWSGYLKEDGNYKGVIQKFLTKKVVSRAKAIMAISRPMIDAMKSHTLQGKYYQINNVVDAEVFKYEAVDMNSSSKLKLLHVSSLVDREKNISGILNVVSKLIHAKINVQLILIGSGDEEEKHKAYANELKLTEEHVVFKGSKSPEQVACEMNKANFLLMFSNFEGQPCVILEALCCGLPVIATRTGAIPELINTQDKGHLVKPKDETTLFELIKLLSKGKKSTDRLSLSKESILTFNQTVIAKEITDIYDKYLKD